MRKAKDTILSKTLDAMAGIAVELMFIGSILIVALIISYVSSGMVR